MLHRFGFSWLLVGLLSSCIVFQATGQLTALNSDGKVAVFYLNGYGYRDTIFVFNQAPQPKTGDLSLLQDELSTFRWYRFDYDAQKFSEQPFYEIGNVTSTSRTNLTQGGYKVTVTSQGDLAPRDSFVAWLYMNPANFGFELLKDDRGELLYNYKNCFFTDFILRPNTEQSSFRYYNPGRLEQGALTFDNRISYAMRRGDDPEEILSLNVQGNIQYLRDNMPPYEDTQYSFRAYDMFGVERKDEIMYRSIIPFVKIDEPHLPETDPASAPVPVKFTYTPYNVSEYVWLFGDGDSVVYNLENLAPDTIKHTYYAPNKQPGHRVTVKVISLNRCAPVHTIEPVMVIVEDPLLEVGNVFTPNNDGFNDYFKPHTLSLRQFEIWIFTRAGKRVYYYRGDDLRSWEGWDGRIENSGHDAAPGIYFYSIRALGWDNPSTRNPQPGPYNGSVYLYR